MQALMLAAGMGKRLGSLTQNATKCMVKLDADCGGKSLIEYALEALAANGITKMTMVVGYKSDILKDFLRKTYGESCGPGVLSVQFIDNKVFDKTNNIYSLYLAREVLCQDDTILLESDLIFTPDILKKLIECADANVAVVSHYEAWMDGTCALLDKERNIVGIIDKSRFEWRATADYYKTVNIYKFSRDFSKNLYVPFLEAYQKAFGKNEYYEQVLKALSILGANSIKALCVSGDGWHEIDDKADLAIASTKFAPPARKLALLQARYGGYWRFPSLLDFCYLVNPYFPPKELLDELKLSFDTLVRDYPSGAKEISLLAGKVFSVSEKYIAVGNGAAELIKTVAESVSREKVLIPFPTFNEYTARFSIDENNSNIVAFDSSKTCFSYTASDILDAVRSSGVKTVVLINPDNPSGNFILKNDALTLLKALGKMGVTLVWDESFIDFAESSDRYSLIDDEVLEDNPNLIAIKSISKSHGVPGLRLGVVASGNKALISTVQKANSIWNINSLAEGYLQIFDKYKKTFQTACDKIATERASFSLRLQNECGFEVCKSAANYLLCKLGEGCPFNATQLATKLLADNIFIKDLSSKRGFENGRWIRVAVRSKSDNDALIKALLCYIK